MNDNTRNHPCSDRKADDEAEETPSELDTIDTIKPREVSQENLPSEKDLTGKVAGKDIVPKIEEDNSP